MDLNFKPARYMAQQAQADFDRARRRAFFSQLISVLRQKPNWLLSFDDVQKAIPIQGQHYSGLQQVPIAQIVGSVDRYADFDRRFLPTQSYTRPRWESVDVANLTDVALPPVQLYKIDKAYFVKDGNHRVSVAKERGVEFIDAEVIEMPTPIDLSPSTDPRDLIRLGEYGGFLLKTGLDRLRPGVRIDFSTLGRYDVLLEHISAHGWYMGIEQGHPIKWEESVLDWYDDIYLPVVQAIRENDILRSFAGKTEGDLYLWIMDHRWYLHEETGRDMGANTATLSYNATYGRWTHRLLRFLRRSRFQGTQL
jgi:hypothetical protein